MPLFDLPLDELREYRPKLVAPADFDEFWRTTLAEAAGHPLAAQFTPHDAGLNNVDVYDVRYAGWGGDPIAGWLLVPRGGDEPVPCVVYYLGYGGGRGLPYDHTVWPAAGYAVLVMDTRGVAGTYGRPGVTTDPHGGVSVPGFLTRGIESPQAYYYRRVYTDAVRAIDVAAQAPGVDAQRLVLAGGSQGGAITQAAAALHTLIGGDRVRAALIDVPFMTHIRRAIDITDREPYQELVRYFATQRVSAEQVFATLDYFDGVFFAERGTVPARYSAALRDEICPPSTVFAAYNAWVGPKEISVWPYNGHEGGGTEQLGGHLRYLATLLGAYTSA